LSQKVNEWLKKVFRFGEERKNKDKKFDFVISLKRIL
jgi:hypothetical protein